MTTRFKGRDFSTLRTEIIDFFKSRFPSDWDYNNIADPMVIVAESLAKVGDQLHYTADMLRRECDISTAQRASSIYSYALREGYRMLLPQGAFCNIYFNSKPDKHINLNIKKFDEAQIENSNLKLYACNNLNSNLKKESDIITSTSDIVKNRFVLGELDTYVFKYNNITSDSTVELPYPFIDSNLVELIVKTDGVETKWECIDDVISSGFYGNFYSLTPKFISGNTTLNIEFPFNFRDYFNNTSTFTFKFIKIQNTTLDNTIKLKLPNSWFSTEEGYSESVTSDDVIYTMSNNISGYRGFEDPNSVRSNYKLYLKDFSSLLTKDDYLRYIKTITSGRCEVFDISDNFFSENIYSTLVPRTVYIATDLLHEDRQALYNELVNRSSRSDLMGVFPYGKYPYIIMIKATCNLFGSSESEIATAVKSELLKYYGSTIDTLYPEESYIDYLSHKASDKVLKVETKLLLDCQYGKTQDDWGIDSFFYQHKNEIFNLIGTSDIQSQSSDYLPYKYYVLYNKPLKILPHQVTYTFNNLPIDNYDKAYDTFKSFNYDKKDYDVSDDRIIRYYISSGPINDEYSSGIDPTYNDYHFMVPTLSKVVVIIEAYK